jgi:hypothetical protein
MRGKKLDLPEDFKALEERVKRLEELHGHAHVFPAPVYIPYVPHPGIYPGPYSHPYWPYQPNFYCGGSGTANGIGSSENSNIYGNAVGAH